MSRILSPDCSKLAKNTENDNDVTISRYDVNNKFLWRRFVSLVKFSNWFNCHVNINTGSGIMTIFFNKRLTRNPGIGNTPSEFFLISEDWVELWTPHLAWLFLLECYWILHNSRLTAFTVFELLQEIQLGRGQNYTPPPRLGLNSFRGNIKFSKKINKKKKKN